MSLQSRYQPAENTPLAIGLVLCGVIMFTPVFAAGKLADGLLPAVVLVWLRYLGGAMTMGGYVALRGLPDGTLKSPQWKLHLLRAGLGTSGLGCIIYASSRLPVVDAAAIGLTKGVMAIALAGLLLRETILLRHWVAGILCALGAYLVVRSSSVVSDLPGPWAWDGVVAALLGAFFIACEALMIKVLARRESSVLVLGYVNTFAAVIMAGPVAWIAATNGVDWSFALPFLALGPVAIIGQTFNIEAYRRADAATLAPVGYSWVLTAAALGYFVFGEVPTPKAAFGALLIVAGGLVLTFSGSFRLRFSSPR